MVEKWLTLRSRKRSAVEKISSGLACLRKDLEDYARKTGGTFLLYGSAARGDYGFNSDVDILLDFTAENESDAWEFAEAECRKLGLVPDVRPKRFCEERFIDHIARDAEVIS